MTLLEHTYAIRNLLSKGVASDDSQYSLRLIAHFLNVSRAMLTEQKSDRYRYLSEQSFQTLCVPLEKGSIANCCDYPNAGCTLLKSKIKIPKFLTTRSGDFIKVTTLNGEVIPKTSILKNKLSKYSITNKADKPGWFILNDYLYIINNTDLEVVLLNSLFENPSEIDKLNCSNSTNGTSTSSTTCSDIFDNEYPIEPDLVEGVYRKTLDLIRFSISLPPKDRENNAQDDQVSGQLA
jgi:hypothetical protein